MVTPYLLYPSLILVEAAHQGVGVITTPLLYLFLILVEAGHQGVLWSVPNSGEAAHQGVKW